MTPDIASVLNKQPVSRRTALSFGLGCLGGFAALTMPDFGLAAQNASSAVHEWTGTALGAPARILIAHHGRKAAQQALHQALMELERIEDQFSLYRDTSALSRLNRNSVLDTPSLDMRYLLNIAINISALSGGAFDVSVQPLWSLIAEHATQYPANANALSTQKLTTVRRLVDYRRIRLSNRRVSLDPGMALTLNGIAQGYATDRVAAILWTSGFRDVLVELGEAYGAGERAPSVPWRLGIREAGPNFWTPLAERAIAVSSSNGTALALNNEVSHILNPQTGNPISENRTVYVMHPSATVADALSTALCVLPPEKAQGLLTNFPGAEAFEIQPAGNPVSLTQPNKART